MPTPWLVTSPPTQIKQKVARAANQANRCSQGLSEDRVMRSNDACPELAERALNCQQLQIGSEPPDVGCYPSPGWPAVASRAKAGRRALTSRRQSEPPDVGCYQIDGGAAAEKNNLYGISTVKSCLAVPFTSI